MIYENFKLNEINLIKFSVVILILLIVSKFFLTNTNQLINFSYADKVYNKKINNLENKERDWGPVFYKAYAEINESSKKIIIFKIVEFTCLFLSILVIFSIYKKLDFEDINYQYFKMFNLIIILLSSSIYYSFIYGSGDLITSFIVISQFYFFLTRKYFLSCVLIFIGVYYKIVTILFFLPILFFSFISKTEKKLFFYACIIFIFLLLSSLILKYEFIFYPYNIFNNFLSANDIFIPPLSYELFDIRTFVIKILSYSKLVSFEYSNDYSKLNFNMIIIFSAIYSLCTLISVIFLKTLELASKYKNNRDFYLVNFFIFYGFIYLLLFFEMSVEKSLMAILSIISPLILISYKKKLPYLPIFLFLLGLFLYGNIFPISVMQNIQILNFFGKLLSIAGPISPWGQYIFYNVPYFGLIFIFISYVLLFREKINPKRF
jgi:hypothetical protein